MKLFDWSLRLSGLPIHQAVPVFSRLMELEGAALIDHQVRQRHNIFSYHSSKNRFYRQWLKENGIHEIEGVDWHALPVMKKQALQGTLESKISEPYLQVPLFKNSTSGSSGVPFQFAKDKWCHALTWASIKYRIGQHGIDFNKSWQARFYGIPLSPLKYYKERVKDWFSHRVRFPVFNLNDETCARYVEQFRQKRFQYINGYTSSLVLFANYCIRHSIVLKDVCPSLTHCLPTSEMCDDIDRHTLQQGFGVPVVREYGAAELDLLAVEDRTGDWVLNEETLYIEVLDENNWPVPDGVAGKIVVTALYNQALPLIRYELGDVGAIDERRTPTGRRILKQLEGRTNDVAILPSGRKAPGLTFYYVTKSSLTQVQGIREFVVLQVAPDAFVLEYVAEQALTDAEERNIKGLMDQYLEPGLQIRFEKVEHINRTKVGKLRQFQNLMTPPAR